MCSLKASYCTQPLLGYTVEEGPYCSGCKPFFETLEIRFDVAVLIEKFVFYVSYKKIGVAGSHFCAHNCTINLLIIVAGE